MLRAQLRLEAARRHDRHCQLCEHRCGADRARGERGPCHAGVEARVFRHRVEYGEELELTPCHLFYLSGCDLRCAFCVAEANAFDPKRGELLTPEYFRLAVELGRTQCPKTLQWVGGEPTIHLPRILEVMAESGPLPPIVWKSDFHGTPEAFELLDGIADWYVADLKFGNDDCAKRIARVDHYWAIVTRNLERVAGSGTLIVRHLLLPGHAECCYGPIVAWLAERLPQVRFSLRHGYLPRWRAGQFADLNRYLSPGEAAAARERAEAAGLQLVR
ncbi:MAG TPA: radical SAM protein [Planctomycetaceae bacterium]|nr:radical SAM protein [Planctomycetaceae bacterium]